ncbi:tRNA pseudouridine synthase 1 [Podila epigama]|nr:tRNA pseudouridine synthase 1 [Podila epigama]
MSNPESVVMSAPDVVSKREAEAVQDTLLPTSSTPIAATADDVVQEVSCGESAAKRQRVKIEKEDTSSYMGNKRSKVRGNIRGADKYKGKNRNAEDAAKAATAGDVSTEKEPVEAGEENEDEARIPKRKIALLMGYCGTGYQGMQVNPGAKTIEGDLFKAMIKAGAVSKQNADDIKKVSMMRSARTDKGVHAAGNVVSLKMIIEDADIVERINEHLPEQIRVFGYVRTQNSFNAKVLCDSRVYEYLLPTYVFLPRPDQPERLAEETNAKVVVREDAPEGSNAWDSRVHISTAEEMTEKRKYRIDPVTLAKVRKGLAAYIGTKNFHNFTVGHDFKEKTCNRYIMSFDVEPKMIEGTEWLSLKVHGQSFMLHQIRKMVGLIIMIIRTDTPLKLIPETFKANKINIPKAPSLGLLLERPMFDTYNRKVEHKNPPLVFDPYTEQMDQFKEKYIYEGIIKEELTYNRFDEYLQILDGNADKYNFGYLNKDGVIPEDAIIKRGYPLSKTESDEEGNTSA